MATKVTDDPAAETQHNSPQLRPNRFFDWMRELGIPRQPGWIGGVCAGVGARLGIDPLIVRGIIVVLGIFGAPVLLVYAAAWLLLPGSGDKIHLEQLVRGRPEPALAGIGVMALLAMLPTGLFFGSGIWVFGSGLSGLFAFALRAFWTVFVIALIVVFIIWIVRYSRRSESRSHGSTAVGGTTTTPGQSSATRTGTAPAEAAATASGAIPEPLLAPTPPSAAPDADAGAEELAAWREQQTLWKREHDAWKQQQAESEQATLKSRSEEQRRLRQEQQAQWRGERLAQRRRTRSHPLFSLTAIGAALLLGASVMLAMSGGHWSSTAAITGMAVTLGVLSLAIVVNGFLGRRSGGSSGLAALVTLALVTTASLSGVGGLLGPRETVNWAPTASINGVGFGYSQQRIIANGDVTLDLRDYFTGLPDNVDGGAIRLTVGTGTVRVILPAGEYGSAQAHSAFGTVRFLGDQPRTEYGPFTNAYQSYDPDGPNPNWSEARPARSYYVTVMLGIGDITVEQPAVSKEPIS